MKMRKEIKDFSCGAADYPEGNGKSFESKVDLSSR
jgi:hypothetical protein